MHELVYLTLFWYPKPVRKQNIRPCSWEAPAWTVGLSFHLGFLVMCMLQLHEVAEAGG